jgi:hypothetical protein
MSNQRTQIAPTQKDRIDRIIQIVYHYYHLTGSSDEDLITDILADLMHLADYGDNYGVFDESLEKAYLHYIAEKDEPHSEAEIALDETPPRFIKGDRT